MTADPAAESTLRTALGAVAILSVAFALGGSLHGGAQVGLGVAIGGLLATLNLWIFIKIVQGLMTEGRSSRRWVLGGFLKLVGLLGGAWLLMAKGFTSGGQLALGYGALPLGIVIGALLGPALVKPDPKSAPQAGSVDDD